LKIAPFQLEYGYIAMALDLRPQQRMSQQLVMTPQLQQAIKLLQLSHLEIAEVLRDEIEQNPVLEEHGEHGDSSEAEDGANDSGGEHHLGGDEAELSDDGSVSAGADDRLSVAADESFEAAAEPDAAQVAADIDWDNYLEAYSYALPTAAGATLHDGPALHETTLSQSTSLVDHLRWQVQMAALGPFEQRLAWLLVEEINEDGYLAEGATVRVSEEADCELDSVVATLYILQEFDPPGVGARDLKECLLLQARRLAHNDALPQRIIENYLPYVEKRNLAGIARELKLTTAEVAAAVRLITQLEPRPGSMFYNREPEYITPDIYVHKVGPNADDYVVTLNEDGLPRLRISTYYRDALQNNVHGEAKHYIQEKLRSAAWLIRSIHMRQRTIHKVMESILKFQAAFFEQGVCALKPLILRDVADDVKMHESTISRVTSNKYVHTPQGIYELKYFFNSSIRGVDGDNVASESVRNHIERLIDAENPRAPHSDQRIVEILKAQDIDIARRTVAKYREMLKIPSSSRRRRIF
jgi:RNA polymerase sigma-54 factor